MKSTTNLLKRGEDAETGEDTEELLLRGAHGLDKLAVHAVAKACGHVEREQSGVQAFADGDHAGGGRARGDVGNEGGERPLAVGRRPCKPPDGVEWNASELRLRRSATQCGPYGTVVMMWMRPCEMMVVAPAPAGRSEKASARRTSASTATAPSAMTVVGMSSPSGTPRRPSSGGA